MFWYTLRRVTFVICSSIFGNDGNGIVIKRLNSDEEPSADSDEESVASSSGRSSIDAPLAKVPRTSDGHKPTDLLTDVCCYVCLVTKTALRVSPITCLSVPYGFIVKFDPSHKM